MNVNEIREQALKELEDEKFREAVETYKAHYKARKGFWKRVFPYRIVILKEEEL